MYKQKQLHMKYLLQWSWIHGCGEYMSVINIEADFEVIFKYIFLHSVGWLRMFANLFIEKLTHHMAFPLHSLF